MRFLSLRYGADFRRCRLVIFKKVSGGTVETNLQMIEKVRSRILRANFSKQRGDSLQNIFERHLTFPVHEMYVVALLRNCSRRLEVSRRSIA